MKDWHLFHKKLTAGWVGYSLSVMHQLFTVQRYNKDLKPTRELLKK